MSEARTTTDDEALIVAYVDGDLDTSTAAEFEQRLASEPHLEAALREFLAADDLGQQLGQSGLLRSAVRRPLRRTAAACAFVTLAAAAMVLAFLWRPVTEPLAVMQVVELSRGSTRGDSDPSLQFRVRVRVSRSCHVLVVTVCSPTTDTVDVEVRHPVDAENPDWPRDPFPVGQDVVLPPTAPADGMYPFVIADRGLVLICSKDDGLFKPAAIDQLSADLESAGIRLSDSLRLPVGHADRVAHLRRVEDAVRRGHPDWQVTSVELR